MVQNRYCPDDGTKLVKIEIGLHCKKCDRVFLSAKDFTIGKNGRPYPKIPQGAEFKKPIKIIGLYGTKKSPQVKRQLPNNNSSITMHNYTPVPTYTEPKAKRIATLLRKQGYAADAERISKNVWIVKRN